MVPYNTAICNFGYETQHHTAMFSCLYAAWCFRQGIVILGYQLRNTKVGIHPITGGAMQYSTYAAYGMRPSTTVPCVAACMQLGVSVKALCTSVINCQMAEIGLHPSADGAKRYCHLQLAV